MIFILIVFRGITSLLLMVLMTEPVGANAERNPPCRSYILLCLTDVNGVLAREG